MKTSIGLKFSSFSDTLPWGGNKKRFQNTHFNTHPKTLLRCPEHNCSIVNLSFVHSAGLYRSINYCKRMRKRLKITQSSHYVEHSLLFQLCVHVDRAFPLMRPRRWPLDGLFCSPGWELGYLRWFHLLIMPADTECNKFTEQVISLRGKKSFVSTC